MRVSLSLSLCVCMCLRVCLHFAPNLFKLKDLLVVEQHISGKSRYENGISEKTQKQNF